MLVEKKYYPWLVVLMLVFVSLLNYLDRQMLATMRPYMMKDIIELENYATFGKLMAIFLWVYAFMSPLSGMIADRLNRKWLIVSSLFIWSFVTLCMGYVKDINTLYWLRGIMGVSEAFYIPAALSLTADYHQGKTRSIAIGVLTSGIYLGQAIGGFGATLSANVSWQFTFHSFGLIGIAYSLILMFFLREKKTYKPISGSNSDMDFSLAIRGSIKGIAFLFTNIAFWVMIFYFAALNLPGWTTKNWLPTIFSESLNMKMSVAGPLATVTLALSSFVGVFVGGFVSDHWVQKNIKGRIYTSSLGLLFIVPALLCMVYGNNMFLLISGPVLFGIGFGMYDTNNMPIMCQFIPSRYRATGYGLMNFIGIAAGAVITMELGKVIEIPAYKNWVFIMMIGAVLLSIFFQLRFMNPITEDMTDEILNAKHKKYDM